MCPFFGVTSFIFCRGRGSGGWNEIYLSGYPTCSEIYEGMNHNCRNHSFRHVHPVKIQITQDIRAVWSESSLDAFWIGKDANFLHAENKDCSDCTDARSVWVAEYIALSTLVHEDPDLNPTRGGIQLLTMALYCTESLIIILPSFWYDLNNVKRDVITKSLSSCKDVFVRRACQKVTFSHVAAQKLLWLTGAWYFVYSNLPDRKQPQTMLLTYWIEDSVVQVVERL